MKKIAVFDAKEYDKISFEKMQSNKYQFIYFNEKLGPNTVKLADGFDAVCCFVNDNVNAEVINKLAELKIGVIILRCAGFNNVDLNAANGKIKVLRVPAYSPSAVAEHAAALLLTLERKIHKAYIRSRDFNFNLNGLTGHNLNTKTAGIIGTGKIGYMFSRICQGFGMNVICYDPYPNPNLGLNYVSLDELFAKSNIISLHCPLTKETEHIINKESIAKMVQNVVIINTSRGGLIDSKALLEGLESKKIRAAGLDVFEEEADLFFNDNSTRVNVDETLRLLISLPNVIVTSHQGYLTYEALNNIALTSIYNLDCYFENKELVNEVKYNG